MNSQDQDRGISLQLSVHGRIKAFTDSLPVLTKESVSLEDSCPICLMTFASIFSQEQNQPTPQSSNNTLCGATKLQCGHIFCRQDLADWIQMRHGSCPTCRYTFLNIRPPSDSDGESSDGGEYIPNEEEDDDDDDVFFGTDGFSDSGDFDMDEDDLDVEDAWGEGSEMGEWESTDVGVFSEGDVDLGFEHAEVIDDPIQVHISVAGPENTNNVQEHSYRLSRDELKGC